MEERLAHSFTLLPLLTCPVSSLEEISISISADKPWPVLKEQKPLAKTVLGRFVLVKASLL
jgi:hypothetical protein